MITKEISFFKENDYKKQKSCYLNTIYLNIFHNGRVGDLSDYSEVFLRQICINYIIYYNSLLYLRLGVVLDQSSLFVYSHYNCKFVYINISPLNIKNRLE